MLDEGYWIGLIIAVIFSLWLVSLRRKYVRKQDNLKRKQKEKLLNKKISDKRETIKIKAKIVSNKNEPKK